MSSLFKDAKTELYSEWREYSYLFNFYQQFGIAAMVDYVTGSKVNTKQRTIIPAEVREFQANAAPLNVGAT